VELAPALVLEAEVDAVAEAMVPVEELPVEAAALELDEVVPALAGDPDEEAAVLTVVALLAVEVEADPLEAAADVAVPEDEAVGCVDPLLAVAAVLAAELELELPSWLQAAAVSATTARARRVSFTRAAPVRSRERILASTQGRTAVPARIGLRTARRLPNRARALNVPRVPSSGQRRRWFARHSRNARVRAGSSFDGMRA
jgi:hypothetical protein